MSDTCRGCGKPIIWGVTADGKKIPLDPRAPVYVAETYVYDPGKRQEVQVVKAERLANLNLPSTWERGNVPQRIPPGVPVAMVSHFATCPKANEFSGGRNPERTA